MTEKVLITGGAGFIGSHLADLLIANGYTVIALDNLHPQIHGKERKRPHYLHPDVHLIEGDIRNAEIVSKALEGVSFVYHFAAHTGVGQSMYQIEEYLDVNVRGTAVLLDAIASRLGQIKKIILASSRAVYGEGSYYCENCRVRLTPPPREIAQLRRSQWDPTCPKCHQAVTAVPTTESDPPSPGSIYAISKLTQEQTCLIFGHAYQVPTIVLRFFNVYGSRQALQNPYTGVINTFLTRLQANQPPKIYEDGQPTRDFVHVTDIVNACLLALQHNEAAQQVFNVGSGQKLTLMEIAETIAQTFGDNAPTVTGEFRAGDIRHCFADISMARNVLGYFPSIPFAEGIKALLEHVKNERWEDNSEIAEQELIKRGLGYS
jgi:dTDP-L-rhamnose 4-epimerase